MSKIVKQALVSLLLFGAVLLGFSRVDWLLVLHLDKNFVEKKLGELYWDLFSQTEKLVEDELIIAPIDSLLTHLCEANGIEEPIRLHIIENKEVNAFALPDRHLVIYTSLIAECRNEMELCGVMAHEIAHIEKGHVMKKLIKEVGLSVLSGVIRGNDGGVVLRETGRLLSSTAHDRRLESEADDCAVDYLSKANIDPVALSDFLCRLSEGEDLSPAIEWISTHPDSKKRAAYIRERAKQLEHSTESDGVLGAERFESLQTRVNMRVD